MIFRSHYPDTAVPDVSLPEFFRAHVAAFGDDVAFVDGSSGRPLTFAELLAQSASVANSLIARGLRKQDRVAFLVPNLPEAVVAFHGVVAAGGVAMMLNPLSTSDELAKYFSLGTPRFVITLPTMVETIRRIEPNLPLIVIGETLADNCESLSALLGGSSTPPTISIDAEEDLAVMPFSSGTTGFPKGVMLTHRNLIAQVVSLKAATDSPVVVPESSLIAVLPFFHIYGIVAFLVYAPIVRATVVTVARFDLAQYLDLARRHAPPILHVVPPILLALAKYPGELPKIEAALAGAAPLGAALAAEFTARTGAVVSQVYGMTEVAGASHLGKRFGSRNKPGSIGGLISNAEARIVDGEVWVRGPMIMKGYFGDDASTRATIDDEGWLHTGDIGHADDDGDFFLVDRLKELIKYKGMQVAPAQLESVLLEHDAVADAAVYALPDAEAGEIPKAAVVLKPGKHASADVLMEFVQERVAPQYRVRALRFVDQIPRSAAGKVLRRVLLAEDKQSRDRS
jgi:acyl-CoA synthetase (AMP-forming)/AMP-acid ligase II